MKATIIDLEDIIHPVAIDEYGNEVEIYFFHSHYREHIKPYKIGMEVDLYDYRCLDIGEEYNIYIYGYDYEFYHNIIKDTSNIDFSLIPESKYENFSIKIIKCYENKNEYWYTFWNDFGPLCGYGWSGILIIENNKVTSYDKVYLSTS